MKKIIIIAGIMLIVGVFGLMLWKHSQKKLSLHNSFEKKKLPIHRMPQVLQGQHLILPRKRSKRQLPGGPYEPSDPRWKTDRYWRAVDPSHDWKMPINFYGKVVDEKGQPLQGAKIWGQWSDLSKEGASETTVYSDEKGIFSITDKTGNGLSIRISKEGYYTPEKGNQFRFENTRFWDKNFYQPDPNNPVIFHLRKKGGGEPMYAGHLDVLVQGNGTPAHVDFILQGHPLISPDGHMGISIITNVKQQGYTRFDWKAKISMRDGGFCEFSNVEFPFTAPESGYQPEIEFDMPASRSDWKKFIEKDYYIEYGNPPKYGRIHIELSGVFKDIPINYWMNPSGSRNLELNPKTWINKPSQAFDPRFDE